MGSRPHMAAIPSRLKKADDEYQFERAVAALEAGLEHVHAAERLLNQPDAPAPTPPA